MFTSFQNEPYVNFHDDATRRWEYSKTYGRLPAGGSPQGAAGTRRRGGGVATPGVDGK